MVGGFHFGLLVLGETFRYLKDTVNKDDDDDDDAIAKYVFYK